MNADRKVRLVKQPAPAFWSRWDVVAPDGTVIGRVEKKGMSSAWTAYGSGPAWRPVRHMCSTRAAAVEFISQMEGEARP